MEKIEIKNLYKKFNNDFNVLNGTCGSFNLKDFNYAVIGEDGAGKTTLLNIIAGIEDVYEGDVFIDSVNRRDVKNENMLVSYIMADEVLMENKSVYKNLEYVFKVNRKEKVKKEVIRGEIKKVSLNLGITSILSKKAKKCTKFERKLVCLARAELKGSTVLIIDEPFTELNKYETLALWQLVQCGISELSRRVIVAEKVQNIGLFDGFEIFNMDNGQIF